MLDQEQIDQQLTILAAHRQTLGVLLAQQATLGAAYAPPGVANGIAEARAAIARIKATLRAADVTVEDRPDDQAAPALLPLPTALRGPGAALAGDRIAGDKLMGGQALGDKYGIDTAHIYLPPPPAPDLLAAAQARLAEMPLDAIPDVAPLPIPHRMPLPRNPMFVGRDDNLRALAGALRGEQSVAAIGPAIAATGMGGIGKTNLATEFVHRYGRYFAGGVFWLSFADANTIPAEVAACGMSGLVTHPGWGDLPLDQQVTLVRRVWEEPVPRLLVFDNCEDEDLVRQWRPATGGCRVLITSRRGRWSAALGVAALALDTLPRPESVALLRRHRPDLADDNPALDAIAAELGDLPLALHLAGSFLETYHDDEWIGDPAAFLAELRGQAILGHEALEGIDTTYSPTNHQLHVARTFSLSYDRLDPGDPIDQIARALLACAACLAPGEPIPRDLLLAIAEADDADPAERRSIARAIERLRAVGLMEAAGEHAVRMHRLVRWFVERVGDMDAARDHVEQVVIREANRHYKNPEISVILAAQAHLRAVVDAAIQARREDAVWLCNEVGLCLNTIGALSAARQLFESALTILDAQGDGQTEERSATLQNLAGVLWDQGDYRHAQAYLEQVVRHDESFFGSDDPTTASSLNALATVIQSQGKYDEARPLLEQALSIYEQTLGPDHPETAMCLNNLASLLRDTGDYAAARPLYQHALAIYEQTVGPNHSQTAVVLGNLGQLHQQLGDYAAARPIYERALAIKKQVLGADHPETASGMNNLAQLLHQIGDYRAARALLARAVEIYEQSLGPNHPETATSLNNLALLHYRSGDYAAAQAILQRALAIAENALGPSHPGTARCLNNLALLLYQVGDYEAAQPLLQRALAIYEQTVGPDHPDMATSLNNLAQLLSETGDHEAALSLLERALAITERALGPDHPDTARNLNSLALLYAESGYYEAAQSYLERALTITEHLLGPDHPDTARGLYNLAGLLGERGDYEAAQRLYQRALAVYESSLGPSHPDVATILGGIVSSLYRVGDYAAARPLQERALAIYEQTRGPDHPDTARSLNNLAELLRQMGDYQAARPLYQRALAILERARGPDHPDTATIRNNLAAYLHQIGDHDAARSLLEPEDDA